MSLDEVKIAQVTHPAVHIGDNDPWPVGEPGQALIIGDGIYIWRNNGWERCCLAWHPLSECFDQHPAEIITHWSHPTQNCPFQHG
jgi:hypothetical protein